MNILTVDIGTSEVKISIIDEAGHGLETRRIELPGTSEKHGWHVLKPEALWNTVWDGIEGLAPNLKARVGCAAVSGHGESFVATGCDSLPVRDIILNIDSRATTDMEAFTEAFGADALYRRTGLPAHPMYTLPKLRWMRRHEPEIFGRVKRIFCMEEYLLMRLGLEPVLSKATASRTMGFDVQAQRWSEKLLEFAGVEECQMSTVGESGKALGRASSAIAAELGLPKEVIWCTAGYDQACASLGAGAIHQSTVSDGTGTFECASIPLTSALLTRESQAANLPCGNHVMPGRFLTLAYVPGGIVLKWLRESFAGGQTYKAILEGLPMQPTGIFCFPYFIGTGTPWLDSEAKAAIYGLTISTGAQSMAQAVLEGVCYEMRWNLELLRTMDIHMTQLLATGGGAKSDAWLQLKSDIFGCPVVRIPGEASSRGAAMCAAIGAGCVSTWEEAAEVMVPRGEIFEPRPDQGRMYDELFGRYKDLAHRIYGH